MKKVVILTGIVLMVFLGGCGKTHEVTATPREEVRQIMEEDSLWPIQLIDSDEVVYIEGISEDEAKMTDRALRYYEKNGDKEIDPTSENGDIAWMYNPVRKVIDEWFDPSEAKTNGDANFYFKRDEKLDGWRMSESYYRTGYKRFLQPAPLKNPND